MARIHLTLYYSLLIWFLTGSLPAAAIITTVGTDVTLRCTYDAKHYGRLSVCWGRGAIPNSGCGNQLIKTDGALVVSRLSDRYSLLGNIAEGDVSLTITQVVEGDSGTYGCRVDIPGWFNDQKHEVKLTVKPGRPFPLRFEAREVRERTITVAWTPAFDGGRTITAYIVDLKNKYASWDSAVRTEIMNPRVTQATLMDLRPSKSYNIRVFAVNVLGMSDSSNVLTLTTKEAAPEGPPLDMQLGPLSPHTIRVTWKPPQADLRNGVLRGFTVSYREFDPELNQFKRWQHLNVPTVREVESIVLRNLKPSSQYGVIVQAKTSAGMGPPSTAPLCSTLDEVHETTTVTSTVTSPSSAVTHDTTHNPVNTTRTTTASIAWKQDSTTPLVSSTPIVETVSSIILWDQTTTGNTSVPPDPPVVELKEVQDNTFSLTWTSGFEGDSPITGFSLEYKAVNASWDYTKAIVDFGSNQTEATIIEINPSTYNLRMFARSRAGKSKASNVLTVTTAEADHPWDALIATVSSETEDSPPEEDARTVHPVSIAVPVVLVLLLVASVMIVWQFRHIKQKTGRLNMWITGGVIRYQGSESLEEL